MISLPRGMMALPQVMMALPQVMMALPLGLQESDIPDPQAKPVCDIPAGKVLWKIMPRPFPGMGLVQGQFEQHITGYNSLCSSILTSKGVELFFCLRKILDMMVPNEKNWNYLKIFRRRRFQAIQKPKEEVIFLSHWSESICLQTETELISFICYRWTSVSLVHCWS